MKEDSRENQNNDNISSFTYEEKKLLKKYMEEYNDMYQKILIISPNEFISKLIKHVEISLSSKANKYSKESRYKIQNFMNEKIYRSDYKNAQIISENIEKRNRYELSKNYFKGQIIPHCDKDKKNGYYIHTCGERFQIYKYKLSYDYYIMNFDKEQKNKDINTNQYQNILFCKKCSMIYKSSLIKFRCAETAIHFYSKVTLTDSENDESDLPFATWSKYHCNVVINDLMKCQKCSNNLFLIKKKIKNEKKNYIFCKNCNEMWAPEEVKWECLICKKKFSSDAKVYNPLEFKALKICVKDALVDKIKAVPKYLDCGCNFTEAKIFHRTSCRGELYLGELNGKKTVICNKCDSIGFYDGYIWTCPICFRKTKNIVRENKFEVNRNAEKKLNDNKPDNKSVINIRGKEKSIDKEDVKDNKDNISVSKVYKDNNNHRRNNFFNLIKNNINLKEDSSSISDFKNSTKSNNYRRNKIKNILYKEKNNDSTENRTINNSIKGNEKTPQSENKDENENKKDTDNNNNNADEYENDGENENVNIKDNFHRTSSNNLNYENSRNQKEDYFRNFKKRYVTNLSISMKMKTDSNNNKNNISLKKMNTNLGILSDIVTRKNSKNIQEKKSEKSFIVNNSNREKRIIKPQKSLSINEFGYSNIKDLGKILSKFDTKVNINLKSSVIRFRKVSKNQIFSTDENDDENKNNDKNKDKNNDKESPISKNMNTIYDSNNNESHVFKNDKFEEKMQRKDSFISKFNRFKRNVEISRISSSKIIDNSIKNQSQNFRHKKNILGISNNFDNSEIIKKVSTKNEKTSYFKKKRIFQRYKNMRNISNIINPSDINIENKSINKIKNENKVIYNYRNNNDKNYKYRENYINNDINVNEDEKNKDKDKEIGKEIKADNNYNNEYYNDKKRSNSTAADSDNPSKIVYHGKNPRQSLQIKKTNTITNSSNFNINDYKIIKKIGQGSFGQIFLIEDKYQNKYAMKKIIVMSEKDIKKIEKEYQILIDLNSNAQNDKNLNLVKIYGFSSKQLDPTTYVIYVLMELAITDWENEILTRQKTGKYYTEKELMTILSSLINTFADLQKQNISHRDIKPQNILIFKDNKYKLADFGEAKELYKDIAPTNKQTLRGTELYMAPALFHALRSKKVIKYINHNPYKSDVFSFGLCSLFAATLCFESIYDIRELNNNVSIHVILEKYLRKNYSFDVINIISHMLDINETTRKDFVEMQEEFKSYGYGFN